LFILCSFYVRVNSTGGGGVLRYLKKIPVRDITLITFGNWATDFCVDGSVALWSATAEPIR
jgi:hypothetical protein